jgi:hypothetical protein
MFPVERVHDLSLVRRRSTGFHYGGRQEAMQMLLYGGCDSLEKREKGTVEWPGEKKGSVTNPERQRRDEPVAGAPGL